LRLRSAAIAAARIIVVALRTLAVMLIRRIRLFVMKRGEHLATRRSALGLREAWGLTIRGG